MAKRKKAKKKRFYEIFHVGKRGKKEKTIKVEGLESVESGKGKKQISNENRILRNIFITIAVILAVILAVIFALNSMSNFSYKNTDFKTVKFCDTKPCLVVYQTSLPVTIGQDRKADYNFYLRKDPRTLENVSFNGELNLVKNVVINSTGNLNCNGDGLIAVANLAKLYEVIGAKVIKNETLNCDSTGSYMFLNLLESNETKIEQTGLACYDIRISDCQILEATERFMLETFVKVNAEIKQSN